MQIPFTHSKQELINIVYSLIVMPNLTSDFIINHAITENPKVSFIEILNLIDYLASEYGVHNQEEYEVWIKSGHVITKYGDNYTIQNARCR